MRSFIARCLAVGTTVLATSQRPLEDNGVQFSRASTDDFAVFKHEDSPFHSLRVKPQNDSICDARSPQYTGWLDVGPKHYFYWYFESRSDPKNDPLVLWLTGGPGGSSMLGMLQENGPCLVNEFGNGTVHNPYGWSANANLVFLDQPVDVGFSYLDEGEPLPATSFTAAQDTHAFLQLFVGQAFPELADRAFHITGESYGGHYIPALGAEILVQNALRPHKQQINLKSVAIGNGYINPRDTTFGYWETLCTTNPGVDEPVFNSTRCDIMAAGMARCLNLMHICNNNPDVALCEAAQTVCWDNVIHWFDGESYIGGRNRFDITKPCVGDDSLCYEKSILLAQYLNMPHVYAALQVPPVIGKYKPYSENISMAFGLGFDESISTQPQVQFLLNSQIDVLIYQGNVDLACNTAGNIKWSHNMPWKGQTAYNAESFKPWYSKAEAGKDQKVGTYKQVKIATVEGSDKLTKFSFVTVDGSGHMVPQDKPEVALDMLTRWLHGGSFKPVHLVHEEL